MVVSYYPDRIILLITGISKSRKFEIGFPHSFNRTDQVPIFMGVDARLKIALSVAILKISMIKFWPFFL